MAIGMWGYTPVRTTGVLLLLLFLMAIPGSLQCGRRGISPFHTWRSLLLYRSVEVVGARTVLTRWEILSSETTSPFPSRSASLCHGYVWNKKFSPPSARQHPSYGDCLKVKRENYQNCSVLDCVTQCKDDSSFPTPKSPWNSNDITPTGAPNRVGVGSRRQFLPQNNSAAQTQYRRKFMLVSDGQRQRRVCTGGAI